MTVPSRDALLPHKLPPLVGVPSAVEDDTNEHNFLKASYLVPVFATTAHVPPLVEHLSKQTNQNKEETNARTLVVAAEVKLLLSCTPLQYSNQTHCAGRPAQPYPRLELRPGSMGNPMGHRLPADQVVLVPRTNSWPPPSQLNHSRVSAPPYGHQVSTLGGAVPNPQSFLAFGG